MNEIENTVRVHPVIVVGGGPCGIAAAAELKRIGIEALILEKGAVTESIRRYPRRMKFFSTAENIEIAGIPFATGNVKADRNEALQYYRKVALYFKLKFRLNSEVETIDKSGDIFIVKLTTGEILKAQRIVLATGYFTVPRLLGVPGEELPNVYHYYDEPYAYSFQKVVINGAGNSGVEAALELYRHDVDVTLVARGPDLKPTAKYWLVPDLKNRIKEGKIRFIGNAALKSINQKSVVLEIEGEEREVSADTVFLLVGYLPDARLLRNCGLHPDPTSLLLDHHPDTFESEVKSLFLCGTVLAGVHTEKVFIENGREHAKAIAKAIAESFEMDLVDIPQPKFL